MLSPVETEESPTENENIRTDSTKTKITAKQNAISTATQNTQNSNNKTESDTTDKRKLPITIILADSMVKDIKGCKCQVIPAKLSRSISVVQKLRT